MNVGQLKAALEDIDDDVSVVISAESRDCLVRMLVEASPEKMDKYQEILPPGRINADSIPCVVLWPGE